MPPFRLLAIDIDGTLVNSRSELTPATRDAVRRAARAGIRIVLATGRRYSQTLFLVEPLEIEVPLVTASGALVKDARDHRTLFRATFDRETLCQGLEILRRHDYDALMCCDTYEQGFDFFYPRRDVSRPELAEYLNLNPTSGRHCPALMDDPPADAFLGFTMGTRQQMEWLQSELSTTLGDRLQTHVVQSPRYRGAICEILPGGVTKWSAVFWLAGQWQIPVEAICAVGDDINDLMMIRSAGLGVAMGNAQPAVKAVADLVVPTHDEDGLVHVVDRLLSAR